MSEAERVEVKAGNEEDSMNDLVVVGSSAGGIEALSILVSTLPQDFRAPVVLAQHLDPSRPSSLDTILQRHTTLPIVVVTATTLLEPGKVYVVPSNRYVSIKDGHVEVKEDSIRRVRPRPSVDMLFATAAKVYGEHLIAVILTGTGMDGAAGAVEVKNAGGTVIVQNPSTARYPSMPLALPPTAVDFETDIEQIGALLTDLLRGVNLPKAEEKTENILHDILEQVSRQASIDFHPYKTSTILRRIGRRMTITHNHTMSTYLDYIREHPEEVGELVKAFLINVTQFFRDPEAFAYLASEILPQLITEARERGRILRMWTAGCASGEEPYSLAMLLTDLLGEEWDQWSVKIFATDLDEVAIDFARRGLYSENMLKDVPSEYRERFFERTDQGYRIAKTLRQMVIFGQQNLSRSAPFPHLDLVLCRNVLIYFTPELQEYVLGQFAFSLSQGGYLFLGKAETVRPSQTFFELVNKHWKMYRATGSSLSAMRRQGLRDLNKSKLAGSHARTVSHSMGKAVARQDDAAQPIEFGQLRHLNELLLRFLPLGVVVLDRSYHILTVNGTARRLLGLRELAADQDFLHAVHGIPYAEVRNAIDSVFRERIAVSLPEIELDIAIGGNGRFVSLAIALMQIDSSTPDLAVISVADVSDPVQVRRQLETVQAEQSQLMTELSMANKRLNDVNKELLGANEGLQIANEELVLTHEELQATIEEFETTNEELQATNEELETSNEELQAANEELETTNDELRARTGELQELMGLLESERVQLAEMVELAPFAIMVLRGPNLVVEAFTQRYDGQLGGRTVKGRPLLEVAELFWEAEVGATIVQLAHEAYLSDGQRATQRIPIRVPITNGASRDNYLVYTLVPSHDAAGRVSGVVIYAADETEQRNREYELELERLKLIFDTAEVAALALYDAQTETLITGSQRYLDIVANGSGIVQGQIIGRRWRDIALSTLNGQVESIWNTVKESKAPYHLSEVHLKFPDVEKETVWNWNLTPILDHEGEGAVRYMLVSAVEVTEQVQAREETEQLYRLQDEFFSLTGHELRTPLTSMLGFAQLVLRSLKRLESSIGDDVQKQGIERALQGLTSIEHQVRRMNRLIGEMGDITRIRGRVMELHVKENLNLVEVVRSVIEQFVSTAANPITLETKETEILGAYDEERVEQVLSNLIGNAIKYSEPEKPIIVGVERREGQEIVVRVQDFGKGISEEDLPHLFERFYRARNEGRGNEEGLGLGLYIAHEIVLRMGGRMWVESKPGEGSTFYFSLPVRKNV